MAKNSKSSPGGPGRTGHPDLKVKASIPRRFRAGRVFGHDPVTIAADSLTDAELAAIKADGVLSVTEIASEPAKTSDD